MSELSWIFGHPTGTWQLLVSMWKLPQAHIGMGSRNQFCLMPQITGLCWRLYGKAWGVARGHGTGHLGDALPGLVSTPVLTLKDFCLSQLPNQVLLPHLWWQRHRKQLSKKSNWLILHLAMQVDEWQTWRHVRTLVFLGSLQLTDKQWRKTKVLCGWNTLSDLDLLC